MHVRPVDSAKQRTESSIRLQDRPATAVDKRFASILTLAFFSIELAGILHHEMWFDELQAWLLARDSTNISNLLHNVRYERTTALWHLLLYFLTRVTTNPQWMQICHLMIATTTVFLFTRFSPFPKSWKVLFAFGYFPFYEYATISRSYSLVLLILCSVCILLCSRKPRYVLVSALIALLAHTNAYGLILALAIGSAGFASYFFKLSSDPKQRFRFVCGVLISAVGVWTAGVYLTAPADYNTGLNFGFLSSALPEPIQLRIARSLTDVWNAYVPIPNVYAHAVWNTNVLDLFDHNVRISLLLSFLLLLSALICLIPRPTALMFYLLGTSGLLMFSIMFFRGYVRHGGHLFLVLIASLWLAEDSRTAEENFETISPPGLPQWKRFLREALSRLRLVEKALTQRVRGWKNAFVTIILAANVIAGVALMYKEWRYPFSQAKQAADFIRQHTPQDALIAGSPDFFATTIAAYLDRPSYSINRHAMQTFTMWDSKRTHDFSAVGNVRELLESGYHDVVLISAEAISDIPNLTLSSAATFADSMDGEIFYLYELRKPGDKP